MSSAPDPNMKRKERLRTTFPATESEWIKALADRAGMLPTQYLNMLIAREYAAMNMGLSASPAAPAAPIAPAQPDPAPIEPEAEPQQQQQAEPAPVAVVADDDLFEFDL